jgi:FtsP/CotA-like multicopper oxidase with cupredoxin domain
MPAARSLLFGFLLVASSVTASWAAPEIASTNDNRTPAGTLQKGVLTLRLEARMGEIHPDGPDQPAALVKAFAEEGGPLQVPAPLIRVREGTEIHASIRNRLGETMFVHGLYPRLAPTSATGEVVAVPAGEVREVRFVAGAPGTYFYWAAPTANDPIQQRPGTDTQLSGALIVDPRGETPAADRVFVFTTWTKERNLTLNGVVRFLINGASWPRTERLTYGVGETVHMRLVNVGGAVHPMHLHGFYFNIDSRGDELTDLVYPPGSSHFANTERLVPGGTFSLTWIPTRPGNWLFHCHDTVHLQRRRSMDGEPFQPPHADHEINHAMEMMAGPVIGITVRPSNANASVAEPTARRQLRLIASVDSGGTATEPAYGFALEDRGRTVPAGPPYLPGPTIVLAKGEPVAITVENRLPEATAVHWHGIELESYYDGVAGFAGDPGRIAPAIAPASTFEARFTPPRSGTFIYHAHVDEVRQQQAGLSGALIVIDSLESYDASHDIVLLMSAPRLIADDNVVLINGTPTPAAREMRVGERYRLRLINVHTSRPNVFMRLFREGALTTWRPVAKDGRDLPADQTADVPSEVQVGNGETYDFEFAPVAAGQHLFEIKGQGGRLLASMTIDVR